MLNNSNQTLNNQQCLFGKPIISGNGKTLQQQGSINTKPLQITTASPNTKQPSGIAVRQMMNGATGASVDVGQSLSVPKEYITPIQGQQVANKYQNIKPTVNTGYNGNIITRHQPSTVSLSVLEKFVGDRQKLLSSSFKFQRANVQMTAKEDKQDKTQQSKDDDEFKVSGSDNIPVIEDFQDKPKKKPVKRYVKKNKLGYSLIKNFTRGIGVKMTHSEEQGGPEPGNHPDYYALYKFVNYACEPIEQKPFQFKFDEFEPVITEDNLKFHYEVNHAAYVSNLNDCSQKVENTLLDFEDSPKEPKDLEKVTQLLHDIQSSERGHLNHCFFWDSINGACNDTICEVGVGSDLQNAMDSKFGSFENMITELEVQFNTTAPPFNSSPFLCYNKKKEELEICISEKCDYLEDQSEHVPLLALDIWQDAQYLYHHEAKKGWLKELWKIVDWHMVQERLIVAQQS